MLGTFLLSVFFIAANSWAGATATDDYHEAFTYDANGNILTLIRNGLASQALAMDTFSYRYTPNTNRLDHVKDAVNAANYNIDIDNQDTTNYRYDAIGNLTKDVSEGIDTILWTLYGKVAAVSKADSNLLIRFAYNPMGQRVEKEVIRNADTTKTLYVHDASGNIMAIYTLRNNDTLKLNEMPLYGSSRLGVWNANKVLRIDSVLHDTEIQAQDPQDPATVDVSYHSAGEKQYELSNHLGNVLATVSDRKIPYYVSGALDHYKAEQITGNEYYAFGMTMPQRTFQEGYRFGYMNFEKDDEIAGNNNHISWGDYGYNPRVVKRWSPDNYQSKYPDLSPYSTVNNSPIWNTEVDGNYWLKTNICYIGTCKSNQSGHNGYHKITSAEIYVASVNALRTINILANVPFAPEVSWTATASKLTMAIQDNSISFGLADWAGVLINVIGGGISNAAKGLRDAKLIETIIDLNRSVPNLTAEFMQEFKKTDYYNLVLDAGAVKKLEKEGYGTVSEDGVFSFNKKTLDAWHNEFSEKIDQNPEDYNVGKFGGVNKTFAVNNEVEKQINGLMQEKREEVAKEIDSKVSK